TRESIVEQMETVGLALCHACQAELRKGDRFCRRCGARQNGSAELAVTKDDLSESLMVADTDKLTPLWVTSSSVKVNSYHPFSGPLAKAIAVGVSTGSLPSFYSPLVKKIILWLITIPIWLIIVLLSPLDAYATVKSASSCVLD